MFSDSTVRHPELDYEEYRCAACRYIVAVPRTKYPRTDVLAGLSSMNAATQTTLTCPRCASQRLYPWNPERSLLKALFHKRSLVPKDGTILACDYNLLFVHTGVYVQDLGIVHVPKPMSPALVARAQDFVRVKPTNLPNLSAYIYLACAGNAPLPFPEASQRARFAVRDTTKLFPDCYAFVAWCLTGTLPAKHHNFTAGTLEHLAGVVSDFDSWCVGNL